MSNVEKPINRNTASIIAKCAVILVVLGVVCFFSIWAWFTKGTTAIADGINVRSRAEGFEVSWDGEDYYDNLQALSQSDVVAGVNGLAKNISGVDGEPLKLGLITGNGTNFFEPYLNRRTGTHLVKDKANPDVWSGIDIDASNSDGKYVDIHLYFRGTSEKSVYLMGDSVVSPKNLLPTIRPSDYGNFTRDYIAAASRVAFIDVTETTDEDGNTVVNHDCKFIWAPNADVKLEESSDGYVKYKDTDVDITEVTTGGSLDLDDLKCSETEGVTYYFWTIKDGILINDNDVNNNNALGSLSNFSARPFVYNTDYGFYVAEVSFILPTYGNGNPSIPMFINETDDPDKAVGNNYDKDVNGAESFAKYHQNQISNGQYFGVTNSGYNIGNLSTSNALYILNNQITAGQKISFRVGYSPEDKHMAILDYATADGLDSFTRGEAETTTTIETTYFPLPGGTNCALVNPKESVAVSSGTHYFKSVHFKENSDDNNVLAVSITLSEQFTAEINGSGATATYKFKNKKTNQYLTLTSEGASLTAAGSEFSLYYDKDFESPILKCGDYFLIFSNGKLTATTLDKLNVAEAVTVYTGTSYQLLTNQRTSDETFSYYNSKGNTPGIVNLNSSSTPPLFSTSCFTADTEKIGSMAITTLTRKESTEEKSNNTAATTTSSTTTEPADDFDYYTSHIIMRVWVEGTDREAKTPLADGIFNMSLHFASY